MATLPAGTFLLVNDAGFAPARLTDAFPTAFNILRAKNECCRGFMCGTIDMAWIPECFPTKCLFFIYFDLKIWASHKTNIPEGRMNLWPGRNLWHKFVKTRVWENSSWLDRKLWWLLIFLSERCILCLKRHDRYERQNLTEGMNVFENLKQIHLGILEWLQKLEIVAKL